MYEMLLMVIGLSSFVTMLILLALLSVCGKKQQRDSANQTAARGNRSARAAAVITAVNVSMVCRAMSTIKTIR